MVKPAETLERVAELLPAESRERFFAMISRLRNVPDDDEYLLILEAIGFMTLVWKEVPREVERILAGAESPAESSAFLVAEIKEAVRESLTVPTYRDLRELAAQLEEQIGILRSGAHRRDETEMASTERSRSTGWGLVWFVAGIAMTLIVRWVIDARLF